MFHAQLHHTQLDAVPQQYRKEAALYAEVRAARRDARGDGRARSGPVRHWLAGMLRHLADAVEPSQSNPSHLIRRNVL